METHSKSTIFQLKHTARAIQELHTASRSFDSTMAEKNLFKPTLELSEVPAPSEGCNKEVYDREKRMSEDVQKALEEAMLATGMGDLLLADQQLSVGEAREYLQVHGSEDETGADEAGHEGACIDMTIHGMSYAPSEGLHVGNGKAERDREGSTCPRSH